MIRRNFFKTLFGSIAAVVAAPLIPKVVAPQAVPDLSRLIPLVQRIMPSLIAADLIGVQPMNGPTGQVFAMNIQPVGKAIRNRYR
jgi:ABC-type phosphate/phosphonate transport system permease subunit